MALTKLNNQSLTAVTSAGIPVAAGTFVRQYTAKSTQAIAFATTPQTILTIPNVVVNANEKVFLSYIIQSKASQQHHFGIIPHYSGSAAGFVGDTNWGMGINDPNNGGGANTWFLATGFVSMSDYQSNPFASTGTFTFQIKVRSTNTSANSYWGGEANGSNVAYTPIQATILISAG